MYECLELNGVTAHDQPIIHLHHVIGLGIELHMSFGAFELPDYHAERLALPSVPTIVTKMNRAAAS